MTRWTAPLWRWLAAAGSWIGRTYARRIVNINVNIITAGVLATLLTVIPLSICKAYFHVTEDDKTIVLVLTFVFDWIFDFVIAIGLHWLANHYPQTWKKQQVVVNTANAIAAAAPPPTPFVKDITHVQLQRLCLSGLLYPLAWGGQYFLLHHGVAVQWSGISAYVTAILITRVVHTFWMLAEEKHKARRWAEILADKAHARQVAEANGTHAAPSSPATSPAAPAPPSAPAGAARP